MPTAVARFPSYQLALLAPTLRRAGIPVETYSLFLHFAAVGWELNEALAQVSKGLVGEWIWAGEAFREDTSPASDYLAEFGDELAQVAASAGATVQDILHIRDQSTRAFLDYCMDNVDWGQFGLVGFSVVFQQTLASLALARRIKEQYPDVPIILGGSSFDDDVAEEIMRGCPWIDLIHCGDADETLPTLVTRIQAGDDLHGLPGLWFRDGESLVYNGRAPNLSSLHDLPTPDFDEYFESRRVSGYDAYPRARATMLPIETARGCWWGQKNHCTFCGLNRAGMNFRAKEPSRVVEELGQLSGKYETLEFFATDMIMDPRYVQGLFAKLAEERSDIRMYYTIRASISRQQLRTLKQGGIRDVQPGIESLSTPLLRTMRKFIAAMKNVELMKWTAYYGINNLYNILYGFDGETDEDYQTQAILFDKLHHFQPPFALAQVRPDRGSPMYADPAGHGIAELVPEDAYRFLFPPDRFDMRRVSYFFDARRAEPPPPDRYDGIKAAYDRWREAWSRETRPYLRYRKMIDTIRVEDGRREGDPTTHVFHGDAAALYELCLDARRRPTIDERFEDRAWVDDMLAAFVEADLMLCMDNAHLALALPANPFH